MTKRNKMLHNRSPNIISHYYCLWGIYLSGISGYLCAFPSLALGRPQQLRFVPPIPHVLLCVFCVCVQEEPRKVCFNYDLFLNLEGNPPVNHLRCEKLTFNNPTKEFRRKLIKAGGVRSHDTAAVWALTDRSDETSGEQGAALRNSPSFLIQVSFEKFSGRFLNTGV